VRRRWQLGAGATARWLDWTLKGDADASWDFSGPACRLCSEPRWTVVQKNLPAPTGPFRQSMYVPVRDGTLLAMNVYRPARAGVPVATRSPVVFSFAVSRALSRCQWPGHGAGQHVARRLARAL
jgi:hypothetical protein